MASQSSVLDPAAAARPTPARRSRRHRPRDQRSPLKSVALHAGLLLAALVALTPPAILFLTSIKPRNAWLNSEFKLIDSPTLDNYYQVLTNTGFLRWFANSLVVAGFTTVFGVLIAASAGYAASRSRFPGMRPFLWSLLITQMFPVAILIVPIYDILARLQLINSHAGLVIVYCTVAVPFCAWMLKGYFDTIPVEIDEAGRVDGLTPFGTFWRLVMPLARPGLAVTAFYSFLTAWGEVAYASVLMAGEEEYTLSVGLQQFIGQYKAEWGLMTAAAVLIAIPASIVFLLVQRHLVAGLTAGGTKS